MTDKSHNIRADMSTNVVTLFTSVAAAAAGLSASVTGFTVLQNGVGRLSVVDFILETVTLFLVIAIISSALLSVAIVLPVYLSWVFANPRNRQSICYYLFWGVIASVIVAAMMVVVTYEEPIIRPIYLQFFCTVQFTLPAGIIGAVTFWAMLFRARVSPAEVEKASE